MVRTTAVGEAESTVYTVGSGSSVNDVNGANACDMSTCSNGANLPNTSVNSCNNNVNAGSGLYANNTDLSELTLPTFTGSTSQVPLHFIRDPDQYFSLKRTSEELRLALVFRAIKETNKMVCISQTHLFIIVLNVLFGRHVSTRY